ncbi:hypothetical protein L1987_84208 [Smallanthus sonchifolius]|uniref:Uncharacterized protein n=1 Tax=Smallanthus sonchifolius TaxID=185202 RepID=A0ACB8YF93_9ASTR|nr:hypothetical protein L1987_84208 [Smallanthus sonchifolius]
MDTQSVRAFYSSKGYGLSIRNDKYVTLQYPGIVFDGDGVARGCFVSQKASSSGNLEFSSTAEGSDHLNGSSLPESLDTSQRHSTYGRNKRVSAIRDKGRGEERKEKGQIRVRTPATNVILPARGICSPEKGNEGRDGAEAELIHDSEGKEVKAKRGTKPGGDNGFRKLRAKAGKFNVGALSLPNQLSPPGCVPNVASTSLSSE